MKTGLGIDIGTTGVKFVFVGKEKCFSEEAPYLAVNAVDHTVLGYGNAALSLARLAPGSVALVKPFIAGKTPDIRLLQTYFAGILKEMPIRGADVLLSYNGEPDEDAEALFVDVLKSYKAGGIATVDSHYAALQGYIADNANDRPDVIVMDLGAGCVNIGGYIGGELVASSCVNEGGLAIDHAIADTLFRRRHVRLNEEQAENCKLALSTLTPFGDKNADIRGMRASLGLPADIAVDEKEILSAIEPIFDDWVDAVNLLKNSMPKSPASILLCGGTAELRGLPTSLLPLIGLPAQVMDQPSDAVINGLAALLTAEKQ